ncbi:MAG: enoyl-CoA hydratase/isomerase family protein, partial [Acidimicrobiales bacterium]
MPETSETAPVCYRVEGRVATITLNRPDRRNVLSTELLNSLGDLLLRAEAEPDLRAVVLTGSGSAFCAGRDLKEARGPTPSEALRHNLAEIFELMATGRRPIIARIAGHCMGGGVGLAAACDISIAIDSARFGFSEARIGVAPAVISVVCLRKMRLSDASELFLTGRS